MSQETLVGTPLQKILEGHGILPRPRPEWTRRGNHIEFFVTSDGATNEELFEEYVATQKQRDNHTKCIEDVLGSTTKPLEKGVYHVVVLAGDEFAGRPTRISDLIRGQAHAHGLVEPHPALALLIRQKFTDVDLSAMGLWTIMVMHKLPVYDTERILLGVRQHEGLIVPFKDHSSQSWSGGGREECGFAFVHSFQNERGWEYP